MRQTWPKVVPILKQYCHESQFEAINIIKLNAKTETHVIALVVSFFTEELAGLWNEV